MIRHLLRPLYAKLAAGGFLLMWIGAAVAEVGASYSMEIGGYIAVAGMFVAISGAGTAIIMYWHRHYHHHEVQRRFAGYPPSESDNS